MRTRSIVALLCMFSGIAVAQDGAPEPATADVFYGLRDGKLISLERQSASYRGGGGGFVFVKVKMTARFAGGRSPVRFAAGENVEFVVRSIVDSRVSDPAAMYFLRRLEAKKSQRELTMLGGHFSPIGGSVTTSPMEGVLPVEFLPYGGSSYLLKPGPLKPGEYALGRPYGPFVFCFGVD